MYSASLPPKGLRSLLRPQNMCRTLYPPRAALSSSCSSNRLMHRPRANFASRAALINHPSSHTLSQITRKNVFGPSLQHRVQGSRNIKNELHHYPVSWIELEGRRESECDHGGRNPFDIVLTFASLIAERMSEMRFTTPILESIFTMGFRPSFKKTAGNIINAILRHSF